MRERRLRECIVEVQSGNGRMRSRMHGAAHLLDLLLGDHRQAIRHNMRLDAASPLASAARCALLRFACAAPVRSREVSVLLRIAVWVHAEESVRPSGAWKCLGACSTSGESERLALGVLDLYFFWDIFEWCFVRMPQEMPAALALQSCISSLNLC